MPRERTGRSIEASVRYDSAEAPPARSVKLHQEELVDGLEVSGRGAEPDARAQHRYRKVQMGRLFHDIGACEVVPAFFQQLDQRFGTLVARDVILVA